jgi:hypothetical protein
MGTAPQALIKMIPRIAPEVNPVRNSSPAIAEILRRYIILHYQPDTLDELETMDQLVPFCVKLNMAVFPGSHFLPKQ